VSRSSTLALAVLAACQPRNEPPISGPTHGTVAPAMPAIPSMPCFAWLDTEAFAGEMDTANWLREDPMIMGIRFRDRSYCETFLTHKATGSRIEPQCECDETLPDWTRDSWLVVLPTSEEIVFIDQADCEAYTDAYVGVHGDDLDDSRKRPVCRFNDSLWRPLFPRAVPDHDGRNWTFLDMDPGLGLWEGQRFVVRQAVQPRTVFGLFRVVERSDSSTSFTADLECVTPEELGSDAVKAALRGKFDTEVLFKDQVYAGHCIAGIKDWGRDYLLLDKGSSNGVRPGSVYLIPGDPIPGSRGGSPIGYDGNGTCQVPLHEALLPDYAKCKIREVPKGSMAKKHFVWFDSAAQ
jgi:hypothetical protein